MFNDKALDLSITQGIERYLSQLANNQQKLNAFYGNVSLEVDEEISALKHTIDVIRDYGIEKDAELEDISSIKFISLASTLKNSVEKLEKLILIKEKASQLLDEIQSLKAIGEEASNEN
ncbi:hypothetical protein [Avibacterium paragallinarum]|uniref:hypothetical protein n=1 Tax=Avibacterium paragallinarum TaxID=728 RepID=UPI001C99BA8A|nr:hypothetical protein [Avibacterium paragallinarum]QZP16240.1 hypothetical protein K5O18_02520 [Avibacterium paragallinarum]